MKYNHYICSIIYMCTAILILVFLIKNVIKWQIKHNFIKSYRLKALPKSVTVRIARTNKENSYKLRYPYWRVAKKDGTRDKRIKNNRVIWRKSELYLGKYIASTYYPYDMVMLVEVLRTCGIHIELCNEEKAIFEELVRKREFNTVKNGINDIIEYYEEKPTEFEKLCARVFEAAGYTAKVTPQTNDGGFDILLINEQERGIAECKCYAPNNIVGRPAIQKLVGANIVAKAEKMFFITTSDFSVAASVYASQTGVELVNGKRLIIALEHYGFIGKENYQIKEIDCQLKVCDLSKYVPYDIFCTFPY